jgi:hypothetical protein
VVEELKSVELMYHPYYEAEMVSEIRETRKVGLMSKESP